MVGGRIPLLPLVLTDIWAGQEFMHWEQGVNIPDNGLYINMSKQSDTDSWLTSDKVVSKSITVNASSTKVWEALTIPDLMKKWMFPAEIAILTDWKVGSPIIIRGELHGVPFENKGTVQQYEPERLLQYSHLSSVSRLPDEPASYSLLEFRLTAITESQTVLTLGLSNFPTQVIYKHLAFYWNVTLEVIKRMLEQSE